MGGGKINRHWGFSVGRGGCVFFFFSEVLDKSSQFDHEVKTITLQGTNISPQKWHFEDDFPFPKVEYVNPLEGIRFNFKAMPLRKASSLLFSKLLWMPALRRPAWATVFTPFFTDDLGCGKMGTLHFCTKKKGVVTNIARFLLFVRIIFCCKTRQWMVSSSRQNPFRKRWHSMEPSTWTRS